MKDAFGLSVKVAAGEDVLQLEQVSEHWVLVCGALKVREDSIKRNERVEL